MSNNPYATNDYEDYAPTNTTNSNPSGQYADHYLPQNNTSSASVNSYGSRDRRRREDNPYARQESAGPGGYGQPLYADLPAPQDNERQQGLATREREYGGERPYNDTRSRGQRPMAPPPQPPAQHMPQSGPYTNGYGAFSRTYGTGKPTRSMEDALRHIQTNWKSMEGDECIPVKVALQLMDPSSLGLADKEADFTNAHLDLQTSLQGVVNEHYADFNSAVGTYHKIQNAIRESQNRVRMLKGGLMNVKGGMTAVRPELRGLAETSGELDNIVGMLSVVEGLKSVPGKLEERISEKRFLGAVDTLNDALRIVRRSDLDGIGAIADLRSYFVGQEGTLADILVEELHDHLYLKSPYCQDRWKGKRSDGQEKDAKSTMMATGINAWGRPAYLYLSGLNLKVAMMEDASKNPEADTFYYIHMILESLNRLGHLDEAIERIEQRMPVELYKVVDKTNIDVEAKYPHHLRARLEQNKKSFMPLSPTDPRGQVLSDFLCTVYSKFEAIAECHKVLHEVVAGIVAREQLARPETYTSGFKELWKLYQMEMRSLLHDYLATDSDMSLRSGMTTASGVDVFARQPRDRNKRMFKLSEMDQESVDMQQEEEELDDILKSSVPGLVSKTRRKSGILSTTDRHGNEHTAAGHKLLIEPSVFNMTILLPPSLAFLQHLKDIVPQTSSIPMSTLTSFLDDFLINVFHPQLEEAVTELCTQCMTDLEAFSPAPDWSKYSPHPIFKGAIAFMSLIQAFSGMLSSIPHDQMFTQLIITQLVTYYDKCFGYYKAIVSRVAASVSNPNINTLTMKAAAAYADSGEIRDIAVELLRSNIDNAAHAEGMKKEVQALLTATKESPLSAYDIISDPKSVHQLSLAYNSTQWLSSSLAQLRHIDDIASTKSHSRNPSQNQSHPRRWTLIASLKPHTTPTAIGGAEHAYLPLASETVIPFDTTLASFRTLAQTILLTLHIDIRCGIIHQLSRSMHPPDVSQEQMRDTSASPSLDSGAYPFFLPYLPTSASPLILELNNDLISFDTNMSSYLGVKERRFITSGLSRLVDKIFVVGADYVKVMNTNGAERMRVDAMVVQQNLRNITASTRNPQAAAAVDSAMGLGISTSQAITQEDDGMLTLSSRYYDLFLQGPDAVMNYVKERKAGGSIEYTYDELRTLIELCYSAALRGEDREESIRARKNMGDMLLSLGEIMWDS